LDMYPEVAGTANSLTGMLRFGIGSVVGAVLSLFAITSERPMVFAMALCIGVGALSYVLLVKRFAD
jgi:bicyclomycin resistance protein